MSTPGQTDQCPDCGAWIPAAEQGGPCPFCTWDEPPVHCEPGRLLGDCELIEKIGRGGMGIVWRGRQRALDREVAIKTLPGSGLDSAESRARFRTEAQATARIAAGGLRHGRQPISPMPDRHRHPPIHAS